MEYTIINESVFKYLKFGGLKINESLLEQHNWN